MSDDRITLKTYVTEVEAQIDRNRLEAAGIAAVVSSDDCGGMRPHLAYSLGVRLIVAPQDADRARELLAELQEGAEGAPWLCPACHEENEGGFEACWNCQAPRPGAD